MEFHPGGMRTFRHHPQAIAVFVVGKWHDAGIGLHHLTRFVRIDVVDVLTAEGTDRAEAVIFLTRVAGVLIVSDTYGQRADLECFN